jgi:flagellar basal-body rod protein FlgF
MDRLVYTAMSGAKSMLDRQAMVANNLANVSTPGFRADIAVYRAIPVQGQGMDTRTSVLESTPGTDFSTGPLVDTGRALDIAITGRGWIAVEAADGSEAYTRAGSFQVSAEGALVTRGGQNVLGDGGPIAIPPNTSVSIGRDGTVSAVPTQPPLAGITVLGRIKLVDPEDSALEKGVDGLFRMKDRSTADLDEKVSVTSGAVESSNVNPASAMVDMIALARQFEMQMKLIQNGEDNDKQATQLLNAGG